MTSVEVVKSDDDGMKTVTWMLKMDVKMKVVVKVKADVDDEILMLTLMKWMTVVFVYLPWSEASI